MTPIKNYEDLINNAQALDDIRNSLPDSSWNDYTSLIRKGKVFLPYVGTNGLSFAPSRFIGNFNNSIKNHLNGKQGDGRKTNVAIRKVLESKFRYSILEEKNTDLEDFFLRFCSDIGITPYKNKRKYWVTPKIKEWLTSYLTDDQLQEELENDQTLNPTVRTALVKARIGQGKFRKKVLEKYKRCLITHLHEVKLLVASHIKPWRDCYNNPNECLSAENALLLSPTWDALFDKGYISFSDDSNLLISHKLTKEAQQALQIPKSLSVKLTKGQRKFMQFHRTLYKFRSKKNCG